MQDDVYVLAQDGWLAGKQVKELIPKKGEKLKETGSHNWQSQVRNGAHFPKLMVNRYFKAEQQAIDELQAKQDAATQELESFVEEQTGEEGLLTNALNDKDKVTKATVTAS